MDHDKPPHEYNIWNIPRSEWTDLPELPDISRIRRPKLNNIICKALINNPQTLKRLDHFNNPGVPKPHYKLIRN